MAFTHEYLKSILGSLTYARSLEAFNQGRVLKFEKTASEHGLRIRAVVGGAFQYKVEIDIPKDDDVILLSCNCMAYEAFGRCKHIGAALFEHMRREEAEAKEKAARKSEEHGKKEKNPSPPLSGTFLHLQKARP